MASTADHQPSHEWTVEQDGRHVIQLHVPGYKPEEMRVELINGILTITGNKGLEGSQTNVRPKFKKTFPLSKKGSSKDFEAKLTNGYLKIILPPNTKLADLTGDQKVNNLRLPVNLGDLSFDKRLAAMVSAAVIVASGLAAGGYFAFRHLLFKQV